MKIMAFGAHPDDVEYTCGGILAKYKAAGHEIGIAVMTNGEVGSSTLSKEEIAAVRKKEAENAAALVDADFFWLNYPDEFLFNNEEVRMKVIDTIRKFRPDIIFCPDKDSDYHPDHTTAGQILWDTHVMVTVPNIDTGTPICEKIPRIYFYDTFAGINFVPELYVDISEHWKTKAAMIDCHKSQSSWMYDMYKLSASGVGEIWTKLRGLQAGCQYAECFRAPKFYPGHTMPLEAL